MAQRWTVLMQDGTLADTSPAQLAALGVSKIDLRIANPWLPPATDYAILLREKYAIACTDLACCIIMRDRVALLCDNQSRVFVDEVVRRIGLEEAGSAGFSSLSLEVLLDLVQYSVSHSIDSLIADIYPALDQFRARITGGNVVTVKGLKARISRVLARLELYKDMLSQALAAEDTNYTDDTGHWDFSLLLQSFYLRATAYHNQLHSASDSIGEAEELAVMKLDTQRNQLIAVTLMLTVASLSVSTVGAVSGLFGMNLENATWGPPNVHHFFNWVCISSALGGSAIFGGIVWFCRKEKMI